MPDPCYGKPWAIDVDYEYWWEVVHSDSRTDSWYQRSFLDRDFTKFNYGTKSCRKMHMAFQRAASAGGDFSDEE